MKKLAAGLTCLSLLGCAAAPPQSGETQKPADTQTSQDQSRTRAEGTAAGAVLGGLLGALIGGGDNRATGALIGALVGAGVGYAVSDEIAKRKAEYASEEAFLDSEIASAAEYNQRVRTYNDTLAAEIAQLDSQSFQLQRDYRAGLVQRSKLVAKREEVAQRKQQNDELVASLRQEYDIKVAIVEQERARQGSSSTRVAALEREVGQLQANIAALESGSAELAQIDDRLES